MSHDLYVDMLRIRLIEETIAAQYSKQQMRCPVHLSIGQEAVAVGVCSQLSRQDGLVSTHRAHAHYLAKGGDLKRMIAEIHGKSTGCCKGRGGSMHLIDLECGMLGSTPILGSSIPVAVGFAFADYLQKRDRIITVLVGDATTEEGVFVECLNFAQLKKLKVLFVCENNFYSVYSHLDVRQPPNRDLLKIAEGHGIFGVRGDGNHVQEVVDLTAQAVGHIRSGKGPALVELTTYRHREHCGPNFDNDIGYRTPEEFQTWERQCPLRRYEESGGISKSEKERLMTQIQKEVDEAFAFAYESPHPHE